MLDLSSGPLFKEAVDLLRYEAGERVDVHLYAGGFQRCEVTVSLRDKDHGLGIAPRSQHDVHKKTCHAAIAVGVRVDVAE